MAGTGDRIGEALAIRMVDDIDLTTSPLTIRVRGTIVDLPGRGVFRQDFPKTEKSNRDTQVPRWLDEKIPPGSPTPHTPTRPCCSRPAPATSSPWRTSAGACARCAPGRGCPMGRAARAPQERRNRSHRRARHRPRHAPHGAVRHPHPREALRQARHRRLQRHQRPRRLRGHHQPRPGAALAPERRTARLRGQRSTTRPQAASQQPSAKQATSSRGWPPPWEPPSKRSPSRSAQGCAPRSSDVLLHLTSRHAVHRTEHRRAAAAADRRITDAQLPGPRARPSTKCQPTSAAAAGPWSEGARVIFGSGGALLAVSWTHDTPGLPIVSVTAASSRSRGSPSTSSGCTGRVLARPERQQSCSSSPPRPPRSQRSSRWESPGLSCRRSGRAWSRSRSPGSPSAASPPVRGPPRDLEAARDGGGT